MEPFYALYECISPYADLIKKKEELSIEVDAMMKGIDEYQQNLDPEGLEIMRLREKIAENARIIESKKAKEIMNPRNPLERNRERDHERYSGQTKNKNR